MTLKIFFDVDYTLLAVDGSLRPGARQTFERLIQDGHQIYIWSGVGLRTADVHRHDLQSLVSGIYKKPIYDFVNGLEMLKVPHWPDFVIDDYPESWTRSAAFSPNPTSSAPSPTTRWTTSTT